MIMLCNDNCRTKSGKLNNGYCPSCRKKIKEKLDNYKEDINNEKGLRIKAENTHKH